MIPAPDLRSTYGSFEQRLSWFSSRVWLVVGCLTSQHANVYEGRIRADTCPCCHTETEVADLTFYFTQSQYAYTGPTSPSADLISPGTWQSNSRSTNLKAAGMTVPGRRSMGKSGIQPRSAALEADALLPGQNDSFFRWRFVRVCLVPLAITGYVIYLLTASHPAVPSATRGVVTAVLWDRATSNGGAGVGRVLENNKEKVLDNNKGKVPDNNKGKVLNNYGEKVQDNYEGTVQDNDGGKVPDNSGGDTVHAGSSSPPLLTLFSTWADNKDLARNLTMANWAQLRPAVLPVLFTSSSVQAARARRHGWHTMPVTTTAVGVPVLKYMYLDAVRRFNTTLVAYANGDILFTSGIVDSLHAILADPTLNLTQKHFLIIGQRTNVDMVKEEEALTFEDVETVARKRGKLFTPNGVDYFITNRNYPWDEILEVVVGRKNYDSYLVLNAIGKGHVVVDVTKTAVAVHQTTRAGNHEHQAHANHTYNYNLLLGIYGRIRFSKGRTDCPPWQTLYDSEGHVIVRPRLPNRKYC